ncbi:TPA: hypothetical protein ACGRG7_001920 [Morganella morganii]
MNFKVYPDESKNKKTSDDEINIQISEYFEKVKKLSDKESKLNDGVAIKNEKNNVSNANEAETRARQELKQEGSTRANLTFWFVFGFFALLIVFSIFVFAYNKSVVNWNLKLHKEGIEHVVSYLELEKILSIIIGALGTSLGFIIGYYFKGKQ